MVANERGGGDPPGYQEQQRRIMSQGVSEGHKAAEATRRELEAEWAEYRLVPKKAIDALGLSIVSLSTLFGITRQETPPRPTSVVELLDTPEDQLISAAERFYSLVEIVLGQGAQAFPHGYQEARDLVFAIKERVEAEEDGIDISPAREDLAGDALKRVLIDFETSSE